MYLIFFLSFVVPFSILGIKIVFDNFPDFTGFFFLLCQHLWGKRKIPQVAKRLYKKISLSPFQTTQKWK